MNIIKVNTQQLLADIKLHTTKSKKPTNLFKLVIDDRLFKLTSLTKNLVEIETSREYFTDLQNTGSISVCISSTELIKYVNLNNIFTTFELQPNRIKVNGSEVALSTNEFPSYVGDFEPTDTLCKDIVKLVKQVSHALPKATEVRYFLCGIGIDKESIFAVDGHRVAKVKAKHYTSFMLPMSLIPYLSLFKGYIEVQVAENYIKLVTAELTVTTNSIEFKGTMFKKFDEIKANPQTKVQVDKESLLTLVNFGLSYNVGNNDGRLFTLGRDKLTIEDPATKAVGDVLCIDWLGKEITKGFSLSYVRDALKACKGKIVSITCYDLAIVITDESKAEFTICEMRL
jgi:DNA polymerase III sliding clamp (beta) subunit (PCNA family)